MNSHLKWVRRTCQKAGTVVHVGRESIGGGDFTVIAGPCAVESLAQIQAIAQAVKAAGASILRGGAFKPRSSPYDFQGLGEQGLRYLRQAAQESELLCISEVMSSEQLPLVADYVDILQIGSRNMHNYHLLKALGCSKKPVLLKRGLSATYREWLLAAEYLLNAGNHQVILCERGIRTFETYSRNCLDLAAVPILRELTHLPIMVDPSHGTGLHYVVAPMAKASLVVGADGVMIEVHTEPERSISDAKQAISPNQLAKITQELELLGQVMNRPLKRSSQ